MENLTEINGTKKKEKRTTEKDDETHLVGLYSIDLPNWKSILWIAPQFFFLSASAPAICGNQFSNFD